MTKKLEYVYFLEIQVCLKWPIINHNVLCDLCFTLKMHGNFELHSITCAFIVLQEVYFPHNTFLGKLKFKESILCINTEAFYPAGTPLATLMFTNNQN